MATDQYDDRMMTVPEAAAFASVCKETIREWIKKGLLPAGQPTRAYRVKRSDLVRFLERRRPRE